MSTVPVRPCGATVCILSIDPAAERSGGSAERGLQTEPASQSPDPAEFIAVDVSDAVLTRYAPFLRRYLVHLGAPPGHVEDLTQETLIAAWVAIRRGRFRKREGRRLDDALRPWLVGIAFHHWSHFCSLAYQRREIPVAEPWASIAEPRAEPADHLAVEDLLKALFRLPPELREVIALLAAGARAVEIADALGLPQDTAYSRIRRARASFARALARRR